MLLTFEDYQRLAGTQASIVDLLGLPPQDADIPLEIPPARSRSTSRPDLMFLLDTNVVSELRKAAAGTADKNVVAWATTASAGEMFVSVITIQELEIGVFRTERRDPSQGRVLRRWLEAQVLPAFGERILPVDTAVTRRSAGLHVPDPRPVRDSLIAATALVHGMPVVTRNVADFAPMDVDLIDPWAPAG